VSQVAAVDVGIELVLGELRQIGAGTDLGVAMKQAACFCITLFGVV
jgi:hypothetical protein